MWDDPKALSGISVTLTVMTATALAAATLASIARMPAFAFREVAVLTPLVRTSAPHLETVIREELAGTFFTMNLEAARRLIWTAAWVKDHPEAVEDGSVENLPYEHMATAFTGTAVQRLTEQALELFGGAGVIQGMPIEKYVRDAHVQKHVSFPYPTRFKLTEALAGFKRKVPPFHGGD